MRLLRSVNGIALGLFCALLVGMLLNPQHATELALPLVIMLLVAFLAPVRAS